MSDLAHDWCSTQRTGNFTLASILRQLTDLADKYGVLWRGVRGIAEAAECNKETVVVALRDLEEDGFIVRVSRGVGRSDLIILAPGLDEPRGKMHDPREHRREAIAAHVTTWWDSDARTAAPDTAKPDTVGVRARRTRRVRPDRTARTAKPDTGVQPGRTEPGKEPGKDPGRVDPSRVPARRGEEIAGEIIEPEPLGVATFGGIASAPPSGVDFGVWREMVSAWSRAAFSDLDIELDHSGCGAVVREMRLPADTDFVALGQDMLEARQQESTKMADRPSSMLRMICRRKGGPPRKGLQARQGSSRGGVSDQTKAQMQRLAERRREAGAVG